MGRPCGPCADKQRNELDRRLLEMDISGESYRKISHDFGYSADALRRHKENHLSKELSDIKKAMEEAREKALDEAKERELEDIKTKAAGSMASKLEAAGSFFDQLNEIRKKAADLVDRADEAKDLRAAGVFLRELREQIRLWAELEGKIKAPQIVLVNNPEWVELRTLIINALEPYPEAREAVANAIHGR